MAKQTFAAALIGLSLYLAAAQAQETLPPLDASLPCTTCSATGDAFRAGDYRALEEPIIDPACDCPFPNNVIPPSRLLPHGAWPEALYQRNRSVFLGEGERRVARTVALGWTPLHEVVNNGSRSHPRRWLNPAWLEEVLDDWPDAISSPVASGRTPLHFAALRAYPGIVEQLLQRGAAVDARAADDRTPMHFARSLEVFKALRDAGADIHAQRNDGYTVLHRITWFADAATVRELVAAGLDPNAAWSHGYTPLHYARSFEVFKALRDAGADIQARTNAGYTALHRAAWFGDAAMVRELLAEGLDPNAVTSGGLTPLHHAGSREIFKALRDAGANLSVLEAAFGRDELEAARTDPAAHIRLDWAVRQVGRHLDASWLPRLRAVNPDFFAVRADYQPGLSFLAPFPLHHAAQRNEDPIAIAALIGDASDTLGFTVEAMTPTDTPSDGLLRPLAIAALFNGNPAVIEALLAAGADATADEGLALYYAAQNETPRAAEIVRALLAAGIDVDSRGVPLNPPAARFPAPVYAAAMAQNLATLDALIGAGADVHVEGSTEHYSLLADVLSRGRFHCGYGPVADRLRAAGARAVRFTESGEVPFAPGRPVTECESASAEIRELIAAGADLDAQNAQGFTALHQAAAEGRAADIRALLVAGAELNARSRSGHLTALQIAVWRRASPDVVNALLAAGAEVDATDMRGWTALHWAARDRRTDPAVVEALLAAGAEVNARDNTGHTALQYATRADIGNETVAALLRAAGGS